MGRQKAGAELLEKIERAYVTLRITLDRETTATRDGEKWSRGSVLTKVTRSVLSEGIRNEARRI